MLMASQFMGCAATSQSESLQRLNKDDVIEVLQPITEEAVEAFVETTNEEIESVESENSIVDDDTSIPYEADMIENAENLNESTGVQIVQELNKKMWTTTDCNGYDIDGTNGEATFFNAGYGLMVTGLTSNDWYRVQSGGYVGFIPMDYLSEDESYSLESITARAQAEAEQKAKEEAEREAARIAAQTEAERKAEEERIAREQAEQKAKESEEQRLLREEQERNAEAARKEEEERLAAEQQQQQTTQTVENPTQSSDTGTFGELGGMQSFSRGGTSSELPEDYGTHGHTGEVGDMADMSQDWGMKYSNNPEDWNYN